MLDEVNRHNGTESAPRPPRVLLVDEEVGDINPSRQLLEQHGFEVFTCTNYEEAIRFLEQASIDFVLVNQGTPAFEGRRVLDRAMQLDRPRPVVVVARCTDMECYLESMQMGAIDYLEKPIPPNDLLRFIRTHVPHGQARSTDRAV